MKKGLSRFIKEVDEKTLETKWQYQGHVPDLDQVVLSSDGRYLGVVVDSSKKRPRDAFVVIDLKLGKMTFMYLDQSKIRAISFSPNSPDELILASDRNLLTWINWRTKKMTRERRYGEGTIYALDGSPARGLLAVASSDRTAAVFREKSWERVSPVVLHDERVGFVRLIEGTDFVVSGGKSNTAKIWDLKSGLSVGPVLQHKDRLLKIDVSPESQTICTVCSNGRVKLWPVPVKDERELSEIRTWLEKRVYTDF